MILYRGTWSPEKKPAPRAYACVFFTPNFDYAVDFAAWEQSGHDRGFGYVQAYRLPKQTLLDRHTKLAVDLAMEYSPGEIADSWHLELFWTRQETGLTSLLTRGSPVRRRARICVYLTHPKRSLLTAGTSPMFLGAEGN